MARRIAVGRRWIGLCLVAAAALPCAPASGQGAGGGPPPARVVLDEARLEEIAQWREVTGDLRAAMQSVLAAQEEGLVVAMLREAGDGVRAGEVVARLDDTRAKIDVDGAEALVVQRRAEVEERRTEVDKALRDRRRIEESYQRAASSQQEFDDAATRSAAAEARLAQAQAELATAEADLARARKRLADMQIVSPFDGRVVQKRTEAGQWVQAGDPVVEIVALDWIDAWLDVPEEMTEGLSARGAKVRIRVGALRSRAGVEGGETHEAEVTAVIPVADRLSRLVPVRVRLDNRPAQDENSEAPPGSWGGRLTPGMSVVGLVPVAERRPTLTVHKDGVLRGETGAYVFFDGGGAAATAPVQVLFATEDGQRVAVRSERLKQGMKVVVEGNERLYPGQPLAPMPPGGDPAPAAGRGG